MKRGPAAMPDPFFMPGRYGITRRARSWVNRSRNDARLSWWSVKPRSRLFCAQVVHHGAVGFDVLTFGVAPRPRAEEDVGDGEPVERLRQRRGVEQVCANRDDAFAFDRMPGEA